MSLWDGFDAPPFLPGIGEHQHIRCLDVSHIQPPVDDESIKFVDFVDFYFAGARGILFSKNAVRKQ
ncbi:MAG: hypothetical protein R3E51_11295 [Rhizobiaceae bacterium]|jgi:hypothetical protein